MIKSCKISPATDILSLLPKFSWITMLRVSLPLDANFIKPYIIVPENNESGCHLSAMFYYIIV